VAPFRRAFVVQRGDRAQLLAALLGATTIWGGTRCPVLPVEPDGTMRNEWLRIAEAIDPAVIVGFTVNSEGESSWASAPASRWPVVPARLRAYLCEDWVELPVRFYVNNNRTAVLGREGAFDVLQIAFVERDKVIYASRL